MIIDIPSDSDFSIHNLLFGIFSPTKNKKRIGVAIGTQVLDLYAVAQLGHFEELNISIDIFECEFLNDFIELGKSKTNAVRKIVQRLLTSDDSPLKNAIGIFEAQSSVEMHLPVRVGEYTDFYSSMEHATNVGKMFRDPWSKVSSLISLSIRSSPLRYEFMTLIWILTFAVSVSKLIFSFFKFNVSVFEFL